MSPITSTNENSRRLVITIAYYIAFITLGFTVGVTGPVLPTLAKNTGTTLDGISIIFIATAVGYMVGTWIGGRAYDRLPGHWLMAAALVITSVILFWIPDISVLWMLAVVFALLGFFQGCVDVGGNVLLIWLHGAKVGPFMNGLHFFFGLGAFVSPLAVAQIAGASGEIRWVYWLFAVINIPIALWLGTLPTPQARAHTSSAGEPRVHSSPLVLILLVVFFFLYVGLESGYGNWLYTYAVTVKLADAIGAAYLTSTFWGAFTLSRLIAVWVSTKTLPQKILYANFAGAALGIGVILLMPTFQSALWTGTIIFGASLASIFPTMLTFAEQRLHLTGSITGWFFVGSGVGHMVLPWLIGQIFVPLGALSMMDFIMVDVILNALVLVLVVGRSKYAREQDARLHSILSVRE